MENAKRRELITSAAAIAFGAGLDEPVHRILASADEPTVPSRVRAGDVAHLQRAVETGESDRPSAGGGVARHQAIATLRWATGMLESSCAPTVRTQLAATTADLATLAACYTRDTGLNEAARRLSLLGLDAARESGDLGMRACVASDFARQEIHGGNWAGGLELAQLALTAGEGLTPNARADLHTVKALAYARKQDSFRCRRHLGAAVDSYQTEAAASDPPWLSYLSPVVLHGELLNARYDLILGRPDADDHTAERTALIERFFVVLRQASAAMVRSKAIIATRLSTLL